MVVVVVLVVCMFQKYKTRQLFCVIFYTLPIMTTFSVTGHGSGSGGGDGGGGGGRYCTCCTGCCMSSCILQ